MERSDNITADRREVPRYTLHEAALFLGIPPATLRSWALGRNYSVKQADEPKQSQPLIALADRNPNGPSFSFYNLAEAHVLAATRSYHVPVRCIRHALAYVTQQFPAKHPLLTQEFRTDGKDLFVDSLGETINASRGGQKALKEIVDTYLRKISRDEVGRPFKLFPVVSDTFENKIICMTPGLSAGRPVLDGRGIRASVIWQRYQAGEEVKELSLDYEIDPSEVQQAVDYFRHIKQAA